MHEYGERVTVSVPIRGLFNLTRKRKEQIIMTRAEQCFRPHQGII